jgi:23S rRNA G2445 N2-methylase RlmL
LSQYFATVARGLEELAAQELTELGAQDVAQGFCIFYWRSGVAISGKLVGAVAVSGIGKIG